MPIRVIPVKEQAVGQFNGGEILENKPIGFPGEGGNVTAYSSLFYWAHAWSEVGSTIGLHPHKGFEILSFVISGEIEHYDSQIRSWTPLRTGDAQIIRSGKGISHSERLLPGSHIFQIWLDPDLNKSLQQPASYNDYKSGNIPTGTWGNFPARVYAGKGGIIQMDTPEIEIKQVQIPKGVHSLALSSERMYSFYLIVGELNLATQTMMEDDFCIVSTEATLEIEATLDSEIFVIDSPLKPPYITYRQMQGWA